MLPQEVLLTDKDRVNRTAILPRERITAVPGPIITPGFLQLSDTPLHHPWFRPGGHFVILKAMAEAMVVQLDNLVLASVLMTAVEAYWQENSVASYLAATGLGES